MNSKLKIKDSKLPFVFSNFAMTADGKIAFTAENFIPFGSARDREHMMELRATADAILCGARTVEVSQATLGNGGEKHRRRRLKHGLTEFPIRVIASNSGSIDPAAAIFQKRFSPIVILTTKRPSASKLAQLRQIADEVKIFGEEEVNFHSALCWLGAKWSVKRLLCEGGGVLNGALVLAGLVDEIHLTICPKIFGGRTAPTIADGLGFQRLTDAAQFELTSIKREKAELFTVFSRCKNR